MVTYQKTAQWRLLNYSLADSVPHQVIQWLLLQYDPPPDTPWVHTCACADWELNANDAPNAVASSAIPMNPWAISLYMKFKK